MIRRSRRSAAPRAAPDAAEFRAEMLAGFDSLLRVGGLSLVEGEEVDLSGFVTRPAAPPPDSGESHPDTGA